MQTENKQARIWEFMTVKEMREALQETKTVILPVGVIEQHGYHLPLNTDVYNACELGRLASERTGCLVAPPITYSFSGGTLPGTINISPQLVSLLIMEACQALASHGLENIIILLGHGGTENTKATQDAADMFLRKNPHLRHVKLALVPFFELSETFMKAFADKDFHAGYVETSLMLVWHPELVRDEMPTDTPDLMEMFRRDQDAYQVIEKPIDSKFICLRITQNPKIQVGVMGDPSKSSVELGRKIIGECVDGLVGLIREMEAQR
ncbi:MAG: creatininase family protein [Firmicutes bacterium]|nr:creatininase family protein [Bacillota bacterium]